MIWYNSMVWVWYKRLKPIRPIDVWPTLMGRNTKWPKNYIGRHKIYLTFRVVNCTKFLLKISIDFFLASFWCVIACRNFSSDYMYYFINKYCDNSNITLIRNVFLFFCKNVFAFPVKKIFFNMTQPLIIK